MRCCQYIYIGFGFDFWYLGTSDIFSRYFNEIICCITCIYGCIHRKRPHGRINVKVPFNVNNFSGFSSSVLMTSHAESPLQPYWMFDYYYDALAGISRSEGLPFLGILLFLSFIHFSDLTTFTSNTMKCVLSRKGLRDRGGDCYWY